MVGVNKDMIILAFFRTPVVYCKEIDKGSTSIYHCLMSLFLMTLFMILFCQMKYLLLTVYMALIVDEH